MARLDHLQLIRAREPIARRKTGGGGVPPGRGSGHGGALRTETQAAVADQQAAKPAAFIDPSLLLRVQVDGHIAESEWERLGLSVVSSDADRTVLLFSSTGDLTEFLDRLGKFDAPPTNPDQKNPNYAGLVGRIDGISGLAPRDRLGPKIKAEGFTEAEDLQDDVRYALDIELWEFGTRPRREAKVAEIEQFLIAQGGAVFDTYIGPSITVMRVEATGRGLRPLLGVPEIAIIDPSTTLRHWAPEMRRQAEADAFLGRQLQELRVTTHLDANPPLGLRFHGHQARGKAAGLAGGEPASMVGDGHAVRGGVEPVSARFEVGEHAGDERRLVFDDEDAHRPLRQTDRGDVTRSGVA